MTEAEILEALPSLPDDALQRIALAALQVRVANMMEPLPEPPERLLLLRRIQTDTGSGLDLCAVDLDDLRHGGEDLSRYSLNGYDRCSERLPDNDYRVRLERVWRRGVRRLADDVGNEDRPPKPEIA